MAEDKSVAQMQAAGARVLQSSPGLAEKLAASASGATLGRSGLGASVGGRDDRDAMIQDLQRQLTSEQDRNRGLEDQYKYRVATFVKRETQTKNKIESLERALNEGPEADAHNVRMATIETMHKSVVSGLECIQNNTAKILQDQEKDLMRAFRARLQEVSKDLEAQRSRKGEHSTELQAKHRRVVAELHEAQELAQMFDKKNQQLSAENQKLQEKLRTREDDRQALLRELVLARKEAARLKAQVRDPGEAQGDRTMAAPDPARAEEQRKSFTQKQIEQTRQQNTHNKQYEREVQYREAITKLKRMLENERKSTRSLKQQHNEMLQQRTELEVLLQQCLDDVKAEIARNRAGGAASSDPGKTKPTGVAPPIDAISVHELSDQDRERVLELLLSQQRVVQLLYSKTFSGNPPADAARQSQMGGTSQSQGQDDFSWLSDIIPGETGGGS